ncbi:hypothetical protein [Actinorugispora endophytica]|uniref:Uncharacterized protein n=1 Tax=Actinorugispora endophytica TaxID=1605990 RepID=A0A4R6V5D8_9ACTN|nr:hypothetical protein [Actinorugispora endophytica]TDQ53598.1 hypothetical protein EV190_10345 [Actinorugispora endophytica]
MSGKPGRARFEVGTPTRRAPVRAAAALAAVALLAAGCGGSDQASEIPSAPEPDTTYGGVVPAAQAPAPEGFTPFEIEGVRINAPEGWEVDQADGRLCMRPPGQSECGYGAIEVLPKAAERNPGNWPKKGDAFHQDGGWAADTSKCRSLNTAAAGDVGVVSAELALVGDGLTTHADGLKSHYSTWTVTCENNDTFEVRLWFLPQSDVAVYAWSVDQQYEGVYLAVAESMDVTEYNS